MIRSELLHEAGLYKAAFRYGRRKVRGAGGGAWHYTTTTKRDVKAMLKAHKVLKRGAPRTALLHQFTGGDSKIGLLRGVTKTITSKPQMRSLDTLAIRHAKTMERAKTIRNRATGRTAVRIGAVTLGIGAGVMAVKAYRLKKRQAQERPQFSSYDVYPRLGHAAARQQAYNRPVYYDNRDVGGGSPRVESREQLINRIFEALSKA